MRGGPFNPDTYQLQIAGKVAGGHDLSVTSVHVNTPASSEARLCVQIATTVIGRSSSYTKSRSVVDAAAAQNRRIAIFFTSAPQQKPTSKSATDARSVALIHRRITVRDTVDAHPDCSATPSTVRRDNNYDAWRAVYDDVVTGRRALDRCPGPTRQPSSCAQMP